MKTTRIIPILLLAAVVLFSGCEKDAMNVKPLDVPSKLVAVSFISPQDTVLRVQLQKSQPTIGKYMTDEQRKVMDATVTISDAGSSVTLTYDPNHDVYLTQPHQWKVYAGKTYKLHVKTADGAVVSSSCTIPETTGIEITDVSTTYTMEPEYYPGEEVRKYKLIYKWRDAPDVKNYYRAMASREYWIKNYDGNVQKQADPLYLDHRDTGLYKDEKTLNGSITSDAFYYYHVQRDEIEKQYNLHLLLVVGDRNYYLYHDAKHRQQQSNGNPFAEPVVMYSNIEGGLGVFAGYNQVEAVKQME